MDVEFECPFCGQSIAADEAVLGLEVQCPSCQGTFTASENRHHTKTITVPIEVTRKQTVATIQQVSTIGEQNTLLLHGTGKGCLGYTMVITGTALCFTIIGIIVGLPMVIGGAYMVWTLPKLDKIKSMPTTKDIYTGRCPNCGYGVSFEGPALGYDCPACNKRFVTHGDRFVSLE